MTGRGWRVVSGLVLLVVAGACSRAKPDAARAEGTDAGSAARLAQVKLALNWVAEPEFGGFYAARDQGAFERHGFGVAIQSGGAGVPVLQMVATGQADFGTTSADELLTARAQGLEVIPLFAVYQTSPQGLMAHASGGAQSIKDVLSSGTVSLEPGLAYATFLKKKYGFDKVKVVPYDGGVARFVSDKAFAQQCFITAEPLSARRLGADPVVFLVADEGFNPYNTVLVTRRALWTEQPARVKEFVAAVREGWRAYLDDPSAANAVMGKLNTTMDAETFTAAARAQHPLIETDQTRAQGLGTMSRERWEALGRQLLELGLVDKAPVMDGFLVPEFVGPEQKQTK